MQSESNTSLASKQTSNRGSQDLQADNGPIQEQLESPLDPYADWPTQQANQYPILKTNTPTSSPTGFNQHSRHSYIYPNASTEFQMGQDTNDIQAINEVLSFSQTSILADNMPGFMLESDAPVIRKLDSQSILPFSITPSTPPLKIRSPLKLYIDSSASLDNTLKTPTSRVIEDTYQDVPFTPIHKSEKFDQAMAPAQKTASPYSGNSLGLMFNGPKTGLGASKEFVNDPESLEVKKRGREGMMVYVLIVGGLVMCVAVGVIVWLSLSYSKSKN